MSQDVGGSRRAALVARWPVGVGLTAWRYMWRTTPMRRQEATETVAAPVVPLHLQGGAQLDEAGVGALYRRRYRVTISDNRLSPSDVMREIRSDPNRAAPKEFARFYKVGGAETGMQVGDEYLVRMPGPWDGPVRVVDVTPFSFRLVTLTGHLEAGQIEFRAVDDGGLLVFEIESWARSGDRLAAVLYDTLRMGKEVQLHMWTSFLEKVVSLSGGIRRGPISIETDRLEPNG
jgi:Domain of unknown function (DUF1990)